LTSTEEIPIKAKPHRAVTTDKKPEKSPGLDREREFYYKENSRLKGSLKAKQQENLFKNIEEKASIDTQSQVS